MVRITFKCVSCGQRQEISLDNVPLDGVPMCDKCFSPMVAVGAKQKLARGGRDQEGR